MSFTPTSAFNTITVCYLRNTGYGKFSIAVDGGTAITTIDAAGAVALIEVTVTCPVGSQRIDIYRSAPTGADGGIVIQWVRTSLSTARCVEILNAGVNSTSTSAQSDSAFNYSSIGAVQLLAPDLTIICLDINDWATALAPGLYDNATAATHNLQLQKIITNAEISGDVILMTGVPSRISSYTRAQQDPTLFVTRLLAKLNGCPLVDVSAEWGDYVAGAAAGYYLPSGDPLHPGAAGYANIALQVSRVNGLFGE
jgi:lysophospholipase L1-like esterase